MTNRTDPLQPQESSFPYQPIGDQLRLPPQSPNTNPPSPYQQTGGQLLLPPQQITTIPPSPHSQTLPLPPPASQWNASYSTASTQQRPAVQPSLRERYTKEQVELYFNPAPDRGPRIAELQRQRQQLVQQRTIMIAVCVGLFLLLIVTANMGVILLALLALGGIITLIYFIRQIISIKLPPIDRDLKWELGKQSEETAKYNRVRPPDEVMFEAWINEIAQEIYDKAPIRLHLRERQEYLQWQEDLKNGIPTFHEKDPKQYGVDLYMEGGYQPINSKEEPRQLYRRASQPGTRKGMHYAIYEFTALFITEDYLAIYTSNIDLRYPELDSEGFEYGYHQHLSHLLLKMNTITIDFPSSSGRAAPQQMEPIVIKGSILSMMFDSGHKIIRNISTLRFGNKNEAVTNIDDIHKTLTHELIDHGKSMPKALKEGTTP